MQNCPKLLGVALLAFFVSSGFLTMYSAVGQINLTDSKLQAANSAVNQAFSEVLAAEKAGANVTSLLDQLNGAANLLAQAEMKYRNGDSATATNNADNALSIAQQVSSAAQNLQIIAQAITQSTFSYAIVFSVGASVVFVLALILVWSRVKRNYTKNLSETKPELTPQ